MSEDFFSKEEKTKILAREQCIKREALRIKEELLMQELKRFSLSNLDTLTEFYFENRLLAPKFKFGARVFSLKYGWGTVVEGWLEVRVNFEGDVICFNQLGMQTHLDAWPTLLTAQEANQLGYQEFESEIMND